MNAAASELARVRVLWQAILPAEYEGRTEVEQVGGGRLMVRVDSAATRYALGRRHGRVLLEALRRELPGVNIAEIRYRLAAGRGTVRAGGGQEA